MIPWQLIETVPGPAPGEQLRLMQRDTEFSIKIGNQELMNSRVFGSEEALAELACADLAAHRRPRVLIGGLGMGYTLAAALRVLPADGEIVVAELIPAVVRWNRGPLAHLAGHPLDDPRVKVEETDVAHAIRKSPRGFDAILLDVDNGPEGLTRKGNNWLYSLDGLGAAYAALRSGGILAVWSAGPDPGFTRRLVKIGFETAEKRVRARGAQGGARHVIWLAKRV